MNFDPNSPFNYDDISKKIFSYLKPQDTKQTLLVSQRFKNITQQTEVHQHTQNIKNIFQWIKNSQDPKKIEIKNLLKTKGYTRPVVPGTEKRAY